MPISGTAQNALHAVLYLAEHAVDSPVRVGDIASALQVPQNYLSKTLHQLVRDGILISSRGPKGGFRLSGTPARITLASVVRSFGPTGARRCLVGRPTCSDATPCAAHQHWTRVASSVEAFFEQTTIADLVRSDSNPQPTRVSPKLPEERPS
jgi:Rrf2 family protein